MTLRRKLGPQKVKYARDLRPPLTSCKLPEQAKRANLAKK